MSAVESKPKNRMPSDVEAEAAVLGGILVDKNLIHTAMASLEAKDFYNPQHQHLYEAMCQISKSDVIDSITLREAIGETRFESLGGELKLLELSALYVGGKNFAAYCTAVLEYSIRRGLIRIFAEAEDACFRGNMQSQGIIGDTAAAIIALNKTREPVRHLRDLLNKALDLFEQGYERKPGETNLETSVPTGLTSLDERLTGGGVARGLVCSIAAESSAGKSALGATIAKMAAFNKQKILICSYEDSPLSVAIRLVAQQTGIENRVLQGFHARFEHFPVIAEAVKDLWDCHIDFLQPKPIDQMCSEVLAESMVTKYDMFLLDYLQTIDPGVRTYSNQERVDYVFSAVTGLARRLPKTATVMISQLARIKGRRPQMTDLYHSGQIEQGSRTIMMIWHPEELKAEGAACIDIAKQHNGPKSSVIVGFEQPNVLFYDLLPEKASRLAPILEEAIRADRKRQSKR